tara:strand:- start:279 stop:431 length:153 start_codon:yes stop_codon:yes gene_type:complete
MRPKSNSDQHRDNKTKESLREATPEDWHDFWYNSEDIELKKIYSDHEEGS